jgi:hypothetical protein
MCRVNKSLPFILQRALKFVRKHTECLTIQWLCVSLKAYSLLKLPIIYPDPSKAIISSFQIKLHIGAFNFSGAMTIIYYLL